MVSLTDRSVTNGEDCGRTGRGDDEPGGWADDGASSVHATGRTDAGVYPFHTTGWSDSDTGASPFSRHRVDCPESHQLKRFSAPYLLGLVHDDGLSVLV